MTETFHTESEKVNDSRTFIIIGGHEDKEGSADVLDTVHNYVGKDGVVVVSPLASEIPEEYWIDYKKTFTKLGLKKSDVKLADPRLGTHEPSAELDTDSRSVLFFSGGDQLRLLGNLPEGEKDEILTSYQNGLVLAGTSAGAAFMGEYTFVSGDNDLDIEIHKGLGVTKKLLIDTHVAQRGREGRLFRAIAKIIDNNNNSDQTDFIPPFGIGLSENTGAIVTEDRYVEIIGEGSATIYNCQYMHSIKSESHPSKMTHTNVIMHELYKGDKFDLETGQLA